MKIIHISMLAIFLFLGCGGGDSGSKDCSIEGQNRFLYSYMQSWYLWYDTLPVIDDFSTYTPQTLLKSLKNSEDRWSFIMEEKEFEDTYNGRYENFGLSIVSSNGIYTISYTLPNSPARKAGIKRGDVILQIDDKNIEDLAKYDPNLDILDNDTIKIKTKNAITNVTATNTISKSSYTTSPILHYSTIKTDSLSVGYVVLNTFNYLTTQDLKSVFSYFKSQNIDNIIFDLRYNGGGLTNPISYIGYMLNKNLANRVAYRIKYNQKHTLNNQIEFFDDNANYKPFEFENIVFLTTKSTASASEMLINGISPFVKTYIIGDDTHGKPVGMNVVNSCGKTLFPVTFRYTNANDNSFGYDGLKANCYVEDDIRYSFGDKDEPMLKSGLYYLTNNSCNGSQTRVATKSLKQKFGVNINAIPTIYAP